MVNLVDWSSRRIALTFLGSNDTLVKSTRYQVHWSQGHGQQVDTVQAPAGRVIDQADLIQVILPSGTSGRGRLVLVDWLLSS